MSETIPSRQEIAIKDTWRLEDFYATDDDFKMALNDLEKEAPTMNAYKERLSDSTDILADCLDAYEALSIHMERIVVYSHMRLNQDESNAFYMGLADMAMALRGRLGSITAFISPEILAMEEGYIQTFGDNKRLDKYTHFLSGILRMKEHVLDEQGEMLLALVSEALSAPGDIYDTLTDADMQFGTIVNEKGELVELTSGRFINFLRSPDREFRKRVYYQYYEEYQKLTNTFATAYKSSINGDLFLMGARKFNRVREANLYPNNIPESVYDNLIEAVHAYLPHLHAYMALRKETLGVDTLEAYDMYVPLVTGGATDISYEEGVETITKSLAPLGEGYAAVLHQCFTDRWVDKYENKGKASGAYSWGAYAVHPYILMNYDNKLDDMFTLTHEAGHALHRHFSIKNQPMIYYNNDIFTAEVASTFNEAMLLHFLLENETDINKRKYLLNHRLEMFRGTMFRQVQFAEFELSVYEKAEQGQPIELNALNELYKNLNNEYFGGIVEFSEIGAIEWARIPHFYRSYYVYQYATGFAAAIALSKKVLAGNALDIEAYLRFLQGGSHQYPIDLLREAGVDMTSVDPITDALDLFVETLEELRTLMS